MSILSSPKNISEKPFSDNNSYIQLEKQIASQDAKNFHEQTEKLKGFGEQISEILAQIKKFKQLSENNIQMLTKEIDGSKINMKKAEMQLEQFKKKYATETQQIKQLKSQYGFTKKKRCAIADTIDTKILSKLKMQDRKSESHDVFRWAISVLYKEPPSKYYWENFRDQALQNDKGKDFKERMGKMSAAQLKEDQRVITQKLLENKNKLRSHQDFSKAGVKEQIDKIFQIAALILEGNQISKKQKLLDDENLKNKDQEMIKVDGIQKLNNKILAIKERVSMNENYFKVLNSLEKKLYQKGNIYNQIINEGSRIIKDLKQHKSSVTITPSTSVTKTTHQNLPPIAYNTETDKKDACTCLLF